MAGKARTGFAGGRPSRRAPSATPPDTAKLHEAALTHLARYAATRAGLLRVLDRRIDRWARAAGELQDLAGDDRHSDDRHLGAERVAAAAAAAKREARKVVERLVETGVVNDAAFAAQRARSLTRSGRSRRAIAAHLAARGVASETTRDALSEDADTEIGAALALARRRRIGPFRPNQRDTGEGDMETRRRELAVLARAGFPEPVARQALAMDTEEAETRVIRLKRS